MPENTEVTFGNLGGVSSPEYIPSSPAEEDRCTNCRAVLNLYDEEWKDIPDAQIYVKTICARCAKEQMAGSAGREDRHPEASSSGPAKAD